MAVVCARCSTLTTALAKHEDADGGSAMCRGLGYPGMSSIAALGLSGGGQLAAVLSEDGVLSVLAAHKLAAASSHMQL